MEWEVLLATFVGSLAGAGVAIASEAYLRPRWDRRERLEVRREQALVNVWQEALKLRQRLGWDSVQALEQYRDYYPEWVLGNLRMAGARDLAKDLNSRWIDFAIAGLDIENTGSVLPRPDRFPLFADDDHAEAIVTAFATGLSNVAYEVERALDRGSAADIPAAPSFAPAAAIDEP